MSGILDRCIEICTYHRAQIKLFLSRHQLSPPRCNLGNPERNEVDANSRTGLPTFGCPIVKALLPKPISVTECSIHKRRRWTCGNEPRLSHRSFDSFKSPASADRQSTDPDARCMSRMPAVQDQMSQHWSTALSALLQHQEGVCHSKFAASR